MLTVSIICSSVWLLWPLRYCLRACCPGARPVYGDRRSSPRAQSARHRHIMSGRYPLTFQDVFLRGSSIAVAAIEPDEFRALIDDLNTRFNLNREPRAEA